MSILEANTLDMSAILMNAYDVGDLIKSSADVADYLYWKNVMENSLEVKSRIERFEKKKELFEKCQRFGHYHPDYHAALEQVQQAQDELEQLEEVGRFKQAESRLDDLLYTVSTTIAHAVSETIKVPGNNLLPTGGGCSSGGSCSGKCG